MTSPVLSTNTTPPTYLSYDVNVDEIHSALRYVVLSEHLAQDPGSAQSP
jgi:hypothetical protein